VKSGKIGAMSTTLGKVLIVTGAVLIGAGVLLLVLGRFVKLGSLPLDLRFERGRFGLYLPLGTMLLLSVLLTLFINLIIWWLSKR
jgi:hypothetical protein